MTAPRPEIRAQRLWLRPFQHDDSPQLELLINDREIAANTRNIEYPYPSGAGAVWIESHAKLWEEGKSAVFAVCKKDGELMGAIGLEIDTEHHHAELGYWIGAPFRNLGYITEAAQLVVRFGLDQLGLHKIHASHLARNPCSGKVLQKIGMLQEGFFREHCRKWGVFEDVVYYGLLPKDLNRPPARGLSDSQPRKK